jgi:hypothetical protein
MGLDRLSCHDQQRAQSSANKKHPRGLHPWKTIRHGCPPVVRLVQQARLGLALSFAIQTVLLDASNLARALREVNNIITSPTAQESESVPRVTAHRCIVGFEGLNAVTCILATHVASLFSIISLK